MSWIDGSLTGANKTPSVAFESRKTKDRSWKFATQSQRRLAHVALEESEKKFRHTINAAADAIIGMDENGKIIEFN